MKIPVQVRNFFAVAKLIITFEVMYFIRKNRISQVVFAIFATIISAVSQFSGAFAFFKENENPLIVNFPIYGNIFNIAVAVFSILSLFTFLSMLYNILNENKTNDIIKEVADRYIMKKMEDDVQSICNTVEKTFGLGKKTRASVFILVRKKAFFWKIKMICGTRIARSEKEAELKINEGVLGHVLLRNNKYGCVHVDVSDKDKLPEGYIPIEGDNKVLISKSIKGVNAAFSRKDIFIAGFLAIDTEDVVDVEKLKNDDLDKEMTNWIIEHEKDIRLIWKVKNGL